MKTITRSFVSGLKPSDKKQQIYRDNLSVVILPSGRLTFYGYTTKSGKRVYKRLMSLPNNKIDDRQLQILNQSYREYWANLHYTIGHRPQDIQEAQNAKAREEWDRIKKQTLRTVLDAWYDAVGSRLKTGLERHRVVELHLEPLLDFPVENIGRPELAQVLEGIESDTAHNRARGVFRSVINWAYDQGRIESRYIAERLPRKRPERKRSRMASDEEIRMLWPHMRPVHKFLLITGQRSGDALNFQWRDLDPITLDWLNPETKDGEPHLLTLPQGLVSMLPDKSLSKDGYVFVNDDGFKVPQYTLSYWWSQTCLKAGVEKLTGHDLRRTALTNMVQLGDIFTAERVGNHALGEIQQRYIVADFKKEKAELLGKWYVRIGDMLHPDGWEGVQESETRNG